MKVLVTCFPKFWNFWISIKIFWENFDKTWYLDALVTKNRLDRIFFRKTVSYLMCWLTFGANPPYVVSVHITQYINANYSISNKVILWRFSNPISTLQSSDFKSFAKIPIESWARVHKAKENKTCIFHG